MRLFSIFFLSIIFILHSWKSFAQQNCVFLPESGKLTTNDPEKSSSNDRPRPTLHRLQPLAVPLPTGGNNFAPDFPNIDVSLFLLQDQNETSIAINPLNPKNIIIGANDYRSDSSLFHFETFDGGLTWSAGSFNSAWAFAARPTDPAVAFSSTGKAFYSYGRTEEFPQPINDVICNISSNGGASWNQPVRVILDSIGVNQASAFADKYYIAADNVT